MLVYRIQHKDTGEGPYINGIVYEGRKFHVNGLISSCAVLSAPEPEDDSLLVVNFRKRSPWGGHINFNANGWRFGFTKPKQITKWFSESVVIKMIKWVGFEVVVKDVPDADVIVGYSQCMITRDVWDNAPVHSTWVPKRYEKQLARIKELKIATV